MILGKTKVMVNCYSGNLLQFVVGVKITRARVDNIDMHADHQMAGDITKSDVTDNSQNMSLKLI